MMVLQQAVPNHAHRRQRDAGPLRPDGVRIAGISGTILLNTLVFLVLLVPLRQPTPQAPDAPRPMIDWIVPEPLPPLPPPDPARVVPPQPRAPVAPPARPSPPVLAEPAPGPALEPPVVAVDDPGPLPALAAAAAHPAQPPGDAAVLLEYEHAPAPAYPRAALVDGATGTVLLRVVVGTDGKPTAVTIHRSSGDRRLDEAARRQVLRAWHFRPAVSEGRAVEAIGIVPIDFNLERG
jgi:periplasmic protein TonB